MQCLYKHWLPHDNMFISRNKFSRQHCYDLLSFVCGKHMMLHYKTDQLRQNPKICINKCCVALRNDEGCQIANKKVLHNVALKFCLNRHFFCLPYKAVLPRTDRPHSLWSYWPRYSLSLQYLSIIHLLAVGIYLDSTGSVKLIRSERWNIRINMQLVLDRV